MTGRLSRKGEGALMKDRLEQELFRIAEQEEMVLPETLEKRIDDILVSLPKRRKYRMNWKKAVVLAAALTAMLSITVTAAVSALQQRMEAMNEKEMENYFIQIYQNMVGVDNYNRPYQESEKVRMEELKKSYEEAGLFPKGMLTMLSEPEAYKGKGVAFYGKTATFFFPEKEMSDEELLQIIDFMYKRDYSLQAMNEKLEAGEIESPTEAVNKEWEKKIEETATAESVLQSEAVWNPEQELTIPYTGSLEVRRIAAGQNCIFLMGWSAIHKMEIGSSDSELFFDDFDAETDITALYQDKKGDIYLALMERTQSGNADAVIAGNSYKKALWILSADGKIKKKIDLSPYQEEIRGMVSRMAVDDQGYIYLRAMFSDKLISVFDKDGNYVKAITSDKYQSHPAGGLGIGKDGKVYTQIEARGGQVEERKMGIASVNLEKGCLEGIYENIVPEGTIMLDIIAPGSETDFVFWGYDGIFVYDLGDECAVNVMPAYEAPCPGEGSMYCALPDGRIVLAYCTEHRIEGEGENRRAYNVPEKTCFYYRSGLRK